MATHHDPHTGQFAKGNPGRRKGAKGKRTRQWEELGQHLTDHHAERFNALLERLWDSGDINDNLKAADLYLRVAEYFRPKLQRVQAAVDADADRIIPPAIVLHPATRVIMPVVPDEPASDHDAHYQGARAVNNGEQRL